MAQTREIKKRMVAVGTIKRITKTMQMIATAKFTHAQHRARATRPYAQAIRKLVAEVAAAAGDVSNAMLTGHVEPAKRELILVIASDRGLCGAYNSNVLRAAMQHLRRLKRSDTEFDLETSGKKATGFFKFQRVPVAKRYTLGDKPKYEDIAALGQRFIDEFMAGKYDAVRVVSMRFYSASRQKPEVVQLLPLKAEGEVSRHQGANASSGSESASSAQGPGVSAAYEFSPSSEAILDDLLPTAVKALLFQAVNEAVVSEQIMRMVAMKAATENANNIGKDLRRKYNRARQQQITTELMEVISGAAALE
jgi:F-type H+-transporting ATPase subunit gamma